MKTYVTDGKTIFRNYYWNSKGEIVNKKTKQIIKGCIQSGGVKIITLRTDQGEKIKRSFRKLKRFSYAKKYLPKNYDQYIDVYGFEDLYCFDPKDPTKVFSKKFLTYKKILTNTDGYLFIRAKKSSLYLHVMVMQAHYKMKIDPNVYDVHHLHGLQHNTLNDLVLLTKEQHRKLHKEERAKNEQKNTLN